MKREPVLTASRPGARFHCPVSTQPGGPDLVPPRPDRGIRTTNTLLLVIALALGTFLLREARLVFIPLAFSAFLTMLLWPIRARLSRRLPGWLASAITVLSLVVLLLAVAAGIWLVAANTASQFHDAYGKLLTQYQRILEWAQARGLPIEWLASGAGPEAVDAAANGDDRTARRLVSQQGSRQLASFFTSGLGTALGTFGIVGLTLGLTFLLLLEVPRWRNRLEEVFGPERYLQAYDGFGKSAEQFRRYLLAQTIAGAAAGILTTLLCWGLGVPMALVWGILSWLFNYLPNVGVFISGLPPTILAFAVLGPGQGALFLAGLTAIELITANLLAPLIEGGTMILSPFEVLAALIFWSWMWGIAGALLSVPITAALVVMLRHSSRLRPVGKFLSD